MMFSKLLLLTATLCGICFALGLILGLLLF